MTKTILDCQMAELERDKARLDWLQAMLDERCYTGKAILRWSVRGRGMRLHETSMPEAFSTIREAIDEAMGEANSA